MFNKNRSAALGFIFVTVLIDVIGFATEEEPSYSYRSLVLG